ncbi:MAG: MATE family efflux transporter [Sutterellaceae bacterium]|nr:MATE family efflux transporter [Sutterellaceae bacterium]MDD7443031.1 MATE family efflux transporter [Sutterellaceae bacterium]MDY2867673.1 MATE family efflux transporter [Mesosutterella sp.]
MRAPANAEIFENLSPGKAVLTLAIPTIIAQLITVLYSVADIFYVGQLGDPEQVAGVRLAFPPFLFLTGIANLFGIGAASAIGRALGVRNFEKARGCAAFAFWGGCAVALAYAAAVWLSRGTLLPFLGTREGNYGYTACYLFWTVLAGSVPMVASTILSHLLRSEGHAKVAGRGLAIGGVANILIAPVFIFLLGLEIRGAAIAVLISNIISLAYLYFSSRRLGSRTVVNILPAAAQNGSRYAGEILSVGVASFVMLTMATVSNAALNMLAAGYGSEAVAGLGIAKQIDQLVFSCSIGLAQGALPLIAYNFSSGNHDRLRKVVRSALLGGIAFSSAATVLLIVFSYPVTRAFIAEEATASYASIFVRLIALACPLSIIGQLCVAGFQGCGAKWRPLIIAFLRKGTLDTPFMILFSYLFGVFGIALAVPVSEFIASAMALALFLPFLRSLSGKAKE